MHAHPIRPTLFVKVYGLFWRSVWKRS